MPAIKPAFRGSGGTASDTPAEIRDKLQTLGGTDRLDVSAIKNLPGALPRIAVPLTVATAGWFDLLSFTPQPTAVVNQEAFVELAVFIKSTTGERGALFNTGSYTNSLLSGGHVTPLDYLGGEDLRIRVIKSDGTLTARTRVQVYLTADTYSVQAGLRVDMPYADYIFGSLTPIADTPDQVLVVDKTINNTTKSEDIVSELESLSGNDRLNFTAVKGLHVGSKSMQGILKQIVEEKGLVSGNPLALEDVARVFEAMGVSDAVATGTWYIYFSAGAYSFGATNGSVTIPRNEFIAARELVVLFRRRTNGGNRDVNVYVNGVAIAPVSGSTVNIFSTYAETRWNIPQTPAGDVRILVRDSIIGSAELVDPRTTQSFNELRGGARPTNHSVSATYNRNDKVFTLGESWTCERDGVTGVFAGADWKQTDLFANTEELIDIEFTQVRHSDELDNVRGGFENPDVFDPTVTYTTGTKVLDPSGAIRVAKGNIPAGAFDDADWWDGSLEGITMPEQTARLLETITTNKLQGSAIEQFDVFEVGMAGHGFAVLAPVSFDGTTWVAADVAAADTIATGIVSKVIDTNNFEVQSSGLITSNAHGLTVGDYYWLGAGTLEIAQPTTGIIQELVLVLNANTVRVTINQAYSI